jgi:TRAP-type C4-dicarboxylate transport system permease large subunit
MGVVLSPCLLVVIISYLSPVTSDDLFAWGRWVFLLSAGLFALVVLLTRQGSLRPTPRADAWPRSGAALRGLLPHIVIFAAVLLIARLLLKAGLDVTSAAFLLPLALLPMLAYDRRHRRRAGEAADEGPHAPEPGDSTAFAATAETTTHVGALLLLMALSACLGGVIERADIVALFPDAFTSPFAGMAALMVVLVVIGMIMDPYGAVILVQATLASAAAASGIDLVHFWMVVLVAFELGYLTPPVALNHLLARQVIGDEASDSASAGESSLWRRHERYLLPITVMALTLVLVAFVPLLLG